MDLEFQKQLPTYVKGSQAQAEAGALALEHLDMTKVAIRAGSLKQQQTRTQLQSSRALRIEQEGKLAKDKAQKSKEITWVEIGREIKKRKRAAEKEEE
jgi:hypothetical protein